MQASGAEPLASTWFATPEISQYVGEVLSQGYTVVRGAVSQQTLDDANATYSQFKAQVLMPHVDGLGLDAFENGKFRRLVNLHSAVPEIQKLFSQNSALKVLDALFGQASTLYTSLFFEIGSGQSLHRDTPYFWTNPGHSYFGMWTALEATDESNGPLVVVPGSHLMVDSAQRRNELGQRELAETGKIDSNSPRLWQWYQEAVQEQASERGLNAIEVHVNAGDTIIWHPQLLHGGAVAKNTARSRRSIAMHVTPRDTRVVHQDLFFSPQVHFDGHESCDYVNSHGRLVRRHKSFSIAHKIDIKC
jgi:phytanoyl-CoA hydroxylase